MKQSRNEGSKERKRGETKRRKEKRGEGAEDEEEMRKR